MAAIKRGISELLTFGAFVVLASCTGMNMGGPGGAGFQKSYFSARSALESGNYAAAATRYDAMLSTAGPLESRLRLEKAHALLRSDKYAAAASEASVVAAGHTDSRRAAALAVVGTAEHRQAQLAMSAGDFGPTTVGHLRRAESALAEMLSKAPDLDPLGSMDQRLTMIRASLTNLGG
jgi:hypothetical protein